MTTGPPDKARAQGHVHLEELLRRMDRLCDPVFPLSHRSARLPAQEIVRNLDPHLPAELRSWVTPVLPTGEPTR